MIALIYEHSLQGIPCIGMVWLGLVTLGVEGVAIAFFGLYVLHIAAVYGVARHLIGFVWSSATTRLLVFILPIVALAFLAARLLPLPISTGIGMIGTVAVSLMCLRGLVQRLGNDNKIVQMGFLVPGVRWVCGI